MSLISGNQKTMMVNPKPAMVEWKFTCDCKATGSMKGIREDLAHL